MNLAFTIFSSSLCSEISEAQLLGVFGKHLNGPLIPAHRRKSLSVYFWNSYRFTIG